MGSGIWYKDFHEIKISCLSYAECVYKLSGDPSLFIGNTYFFIPIVIYYLFDEISSLYKSSFLMCVSIKL